MYTIHTFMETYYKENNKRKAINAKVTFFLLTVYLLFIYFLQKSTNKKFFLVLCVFEA